MKEQNSNKLHFFISLDENKSSVHCFPSWSSHAPDRQRYTCLDVLRFVPITLLLKSMDS